MDNTLPRYESNPQNNSKLELVFKRALDMNDQKVLSSLIYPSSPILKAIYPSSQKNALHLVCESRFINIDIVKSLIDLGINIHAQTIDGYTPLHLALNVLQFPLHFHSDLNNHVHILAIKILLKKGANPYIKSRNGATPIQLALTSKQLQVVEAFLKEEDQLFSNFRIDRSIRLRHLTKCLLKSRGDWTVSSTKFSTFLHFLVSQNTKETFDEQLFEYVVESTHSAFDANAVNEDGFTLLQIVAKLGTSRCIKALINVGADPNFSKLYTEFPICHAISANRAENIKCLFECGASLNKLSNNRYVEESALHYAVECQKLESVKMLVQLGADVNGIRNHRSPLQIACANRNFKIVQFLVAHGADVHRKCKLDGTIIDIACEFASLEIVKLLFSYGTKLNQGDVSSLHCAAKGQNADIFRFLLENGADANLRCKPLGVCDLICSSVPRTAFEFAVMFAKDGSNASNIIEITNECNCDINLADPIRGETLLHLACFSDMTDFFKKLAFSNTKIIKSLLKSGANVNALDFRGLTPLDHALHNYQLVMTSNRRTHNIYMKDYQADMKILVAFIAKMIVRGERVIEANLKLLREKPLLPFFEQCLAELNCLTKSICGSSNFSFLCVLTKDIDALGRALKNKDIVGVLNRGFYKIEFPIYASDLEERILKAKLRLPIFEVVTELFREHVRQNLGDEVLIICKYLGLKDLINFKKACSVPLKKETFHF